MRTCICAVFGAVGQATRDARTKRRKIAIEMKVALHRIAIINLAPSCQEYPDSNWVCDLYHRDP
jgi:hypothetical protein